MDDPDGVRCREALGQLEGQADDFLAGNGAPLQPDAQFFAIDQLHDEETCGPHGFETVDAGDIGMLQGGQGTGFTIKAGQPFRILGHLDRKHLDGDIPPQFRVAGAVDLAHAAFAEWGGDFVMCQFIAGLHTAPDMGWGGNQDRSKPV